MADEMVLKSQQWVNQTYRGKTGYGNDIAEDGSTGWETINALIRAFQIELGITATANNFGPSTIARFNSRFPNGIHQQSLDDEIESNIYAIIQCACWCKGYGTGASEITKHFRGGTGSAITSLKSDAGCSDTSSTVTLNVMKALLSMDQFKVVSGGSTKIRTIQQNLNNEYEAYVGLMPCDGVYGRQMNDGMIKVLQSIEGYSVADATGNFGAGTKANLPIIPSNGTMNVAKETKATKLVKYLLYINGEELDFSTDTWDTFTTTAITNFQSKICLPTTGICDTNTWMALMLSKGNPDRAYNVIDTAYTIYNSEKGINRLQILKDNNINIVGRYITGEKGKQLGFDEAPGMLSNGISFYPIFQRDGTPTASYFNYTQGKIDAEFAVKCARNYCLPLFTTIYFAVDFDCLDYEVTNNIIPYFRGIIENLEFYHIGIYATRNACKRVMDLGLAKTCMVANASTGYSGNMGYPMPDNWNIDQFSTDVKLADNFYIDKNIYSGKFPVVTELTSRNFYRGKISLSSNEVYFGRGVQYSGNKLKIKAIAVSSDGQTYDDLYVKIMAKPIDSIQPNPINHTGIVYAKLDGKKYDITSNDYKDDLGNVHHYDSVYFDSTSRYRLEYSIVQKLENGSYLPATNPIEAEVEVEVSTFNAEVE